MGYKSERQELYTDRGIECVVETLDGARKACKVAGVCRAGNIMNINTFLFHNAIDWLVERNHLRIVKDTGAGQDLILEVVE